MSKKFADAKLREIALMASKGLSVDQIATLTGLQAKSVAHIVWIYRWSPEKVEEMTERSKIHGPKGEGPRSRLRKYFVMHPEQRPAPQQELFSADTPKAVEGDASDPNAHARIDQLHERINNIWTFASGVNERLIKVEKRDVPDGIGDKLTSQSGRIDELERRVTVMHRDVAGLKQASGPEALPVTLDRLAMCEKRIARLQEILKAVFRVLPAEYA